MGHDVYRHMGEIEVTKLHMADIVGVGNLNVVFVFLRIALTGFRICDVPGACPGLGAVSCLRRNTLGEDILLFKQHIQNAAHLVYFPFTAFESGYHGDQHIGVMLDLVQVEMVLVIVVGAFVGIKIALQLRLHAAVGGFRRQHIRILQGIGG